MANYQLSQDPYYPSRYFQVGVLDGVSVRRLAEWRVF